MVSEVSGRRVRCKRRHTARHLDMRVLLGKLPHGLLGYGFLSTINDDDIVLILFQHGVPRDREPF